MTRIAHEDTAQKYSAIEINVTGIVQGVGFRPHIYKLATSLGLKGWVLNTTAGVIIRIEGMAEAIDAFSEQLKNNPPELASIESFAVKKVGCEGFVSFHIHESQNTADTNVSIPPDVGTCPQCLREYEDATDRRHGYEFTNCINCGPRFSITSAAPYDRKNTSMGEFKMCDECAKEYADPENRRFHAEPNACPVCGPEITITQPDGTPFPMPDKDDAKAGKDAKRKIKEAPQATIAGMQAEGETTGSAAIIRSLLKNGSILAIKGIGGYHLSCDATDAEAINVMRNRKRRQGKPFALMCRDLAVVREHCELSEAEESLLTSPARPILLLKRRMTSGLSDDIAPGLDTLGVMLPYTPLHYGLFDHDIDVLVMTSANISGDPLIVNEDDAFRELGDLADFFVVHNRSIVNRADDSVIMSFKGNPYFIRRSRGYVPRNVALSFEAEPVFAAGGDLKSVFAYARGDRAVLSQYFGDLDNLKNLEAYERGVDFFKDFLRIEPEKVVCDLHPDYASTLFAERYADRLRVPLIKVQHHKAHFASALVDSGIEGPALGVVADGTGYGEDGSIWGFEFFYGGLNDSLEKGERIERVGSLSPFPQPRGDAVAKNPLHMAAVLLYDLWQDEDLVIKTLPEAADLISFAKAQSGARQSGLSISSSSCGRLFDAAAALCGFTSLSTYEGEAAMRMEAMAHRVAVNQNAEGAFGVFDYIIKDDGMLRLDWGFLGEMADEKRQGVDPAVLAYRFHRTIVHAICDILERMAIRYKTGKVAISGGTFQNRFLIQGLAERLSARDMILYVHRQVPANDGGLALGQIALACDVMRCVSAARHN